MGWHCKNVGYYKDDSVMTNYPDQDGFDNIDQIYYILRGKGWTTNAVIGLVTCIGFESGYNPWCWEGSGYSRFADQAAADADNINVVNWDDVSFWGYGLVQWTPASYNNTRYYQHYGAHANKYQSNPHAVNVPGYGPNFNQVPGSLYDGYAQMVYLDDYGWDGQYYDSHNYYGHLEPTFQQYKVSTRPASDLCETWTQNFERAGGSYDQNKRAQRQALATALYSIYQNKPVLPPDTPGGGGGFPAWLLMKWRQDNMRRR